MSALVLLALGACKAPPTEVPTPEDTASPVPTADTAAISTATTGDTADPACTHLPALPLPGSQWQALQGFGSAEDFDFDAQGRHVSVVSSGNLVARDFQGQQTLIAPNVTSAAACTRMLPDGDFVVCDVTQNAVIRVDAATGAKTTLVSGLSYPNGGEVDPDGFLYVAEQDAGRVVRIDTQTGDATVVAMGLENPNGVIFSPDWQTLYVGSFGGGQVWAIDRTGPDTFDPARVLVQHPGVNGGFDGINVDHCGNVYITEFGPGKVFRILEDGSDVSLVVDLPSGWIPNMRWGNGVGGADLHTLYVSDRGQGRLFALDMGLLTGKPAFIP